MTDARTARATTTDTLNEILYAPHIVNVTKDDLIEN